MIEKPEDIQKPVFNIIHGAGFAEEDVDAYLGELIPSYNRLMDAEWQGRVRAEELSESNKALEAEKNDLEAKLSERDETIADLSAKNAEAEQVNSQLNASISALGEEINAKTAAHNTIAEELTATEERLRSAEERNVSLEETINNSSLSNSEAQEALAEAQERIRELEAEAVRRLDDTVPALSIVDDSYAHSAPADTYTDSVNLEDTQFGTTDGVPAEDDENPSVVEKYNQYEAVINDATAGHSDRASALLSRAYELGEEYITTSEREGNQIVETAREQANGIVEDANTYANNTRSDADKYSETKRTEADEYVTTVKAEADDQAQEIVAKAEHEAEFVGNSVKELRDERDDILGKLRDYFHSNITKVEEIATLPEYDPNSFALKEEGDHAEGAPNEALEEAEAAYRRFEENKSDTAGDAQDTVDFNNLDTPVENSTDAYASYGVDLVLPEGDKAYIGYAAEQPVEDVVDPVEETVEAPAETQADYSEVEANENVLENTEPQHVENPFFEEERVSLPEEGADATGFSEKLDTDAVETNSHVESSDTQQLRSFSSLITGAQHPTEPAEPQITESSTDEQPEDSNKKKKRSFRDFLGNK